MSSQYFYKLQQTDNEFTRWLKDTLLCTNMLHKDNLDQPHILKHINPDLIRKFNIIKKIESTGLRIENCKFFRCMAKVQGGAHIDGVPPRHAAINFPVNHCNKGYQTWYINQPKRIEKVYKKTSIILPDEENVQWQEGEKLYLDSPTLVHVSVWHSVNNTENDKDREVFSIRFAGNPSYSQVKEIIQEHNL